MYGDILTMPMVARSEVSYSRLFHLVDYVINPVNLQGVMGAGIAKMIKDLHPDMFEDYHAACKDGRLTSHTPIHVFPTSKSNGCNYDVINLMTKNHWMDDTELSYIENSLKHLVNFLKDKPLANVATPMLGCGRGNREYDEVIPIISKHLDAIPNIVHVSMRPDYFTKPLYYLGIIGSRSFRHKQDRLNANVMDKIIKNALAKWELTLDDFSGVVSGGAHGVDTLACGRSMDDSTYTESFAYRHNLKPIIVQADWDKYKKSAGYIRNQSVVDIATHIVSITDKDNEVSVGTDMAVRLIAQLKDKGVDKQHLAYRI